MIDPNVLNTPTALDAAHNVACPAAQNELAQMENRVAVGQLLETLSEEQYQTVRLLYGEELTTRQAAATLGTDHMSIQRTRDAALAQMRKFAQL